MDYSPHYTSDRIASLLTQSFSKMTPAAVVDLGIGNGALTKAAYARWPNSEFHGIDLNEDALGEVRSLTTTTYLANCLQFDFPEKYGLTNRFDVAICNPPFARLSSKQPFSRILEAAGFPFSEQLRFPTSDMVFVAQNLRLLKSNGELGFIFPDTLACSYDLEAFRRWLLKTHYVSKIFQLPMNSFERVRARSHALILRKDCSPRLQIPVSRVDENGEVTHTIHVQTDRLINRMDYDFHVADFIQSSHTLGSLGCDIRRGRVSHKQCQESSLPFFHTTDFKHYPSRNARFEDNSFSEVSFFAAEGDIIMGRVGRDIPGKVVMVSKGQRILTDCVYRIRVPEKVRQRTWLWLKSNKAQTMLKTLAHGVCAKVISKRDLLAFPVKL